MVAAPTVERILNRPRALRVIEVGSDMTTNETHGNATGWAWATFTVRWVVGLIFFMAGWFKCFDMGPIAHAEQFFIGPYSETWIPTWLLWAIGTSIPVVELVAGAALCLGFRKREASILLGLILISVTYGHLMLDPLFGITGHIFPRLVLLVFVWVAPPHLDVLSVDHWLAKRKMG